MSDRLINLLNSRVVLITTASGVGTGSFIARGRVMTCAHVVRKAATDGSSIEIQYGQFNHKGIWEEYKAKVKKTILSSNLPAQKNPKSPGLGNDEEYPDIAILELDIKGHRLLKLPELNETTPLSLTAEYLAYGYQKQDRITGKMISQSISLNYDGVENGIDEPKILFENGVIKGGMSGGPLVERESGTLIGMVQMTRSSQGDNLGACVIPLETIWKQFAHWQELQASSILNELKQKTHIREVQCGYAKDFPRFPYFQKNWPRLLLLCFALFLGLFWVFLHFGTIQNSVVIAALIAILPIAGNILTQWSGQDANIELQGIRNSLGKFIVRPFFLFSLLFVIGCLWLFVSSIWITYSSNADLSLSVNGNMLKYFNDSITLPKNKNLHRFMVFTWPGGNNYLLEMDQQDTMHIIAHPAHRQTYNYPLDFRREPILFIRFDGDHIHTEVLNNSYLEFSGSGQTIRYPDGILNNKGSILIGKRKLQIDADLRDSWSIHGELAGVPQEYRNQFIKDWENYLALDTIDLELNTPIRIRIGFSGNNSILADTLIIPTNSSQDVFLKLR